MKEVTEGCFWGLGRMGVCVGYVLSSIYASPFSDLTSPVVGRNTVVRQKTRFLLRELSGAVPGRRETKREKREEGQKKK